MAEISEKWIRIGADGAAWFALLAAINHPHVKQAISDSHCLSDKGGAAMKRATKEITFQLQYAAGLKTARKA